MAVQSFILSYFAYIVYAAQVAKWQCNLLPKNRLRSAKLIGNSKPCFLYKGEEFWESLRKLEVKC